jgi:hypothetical protein
MALSQNTKSLSLSKISFSITIRLPCQAIPHTNTDYGDRPGQRIFGFYVILEALQSSHCSVIKISGLLG